MDFRTMLKKSIGDEKEGISRYKELAQLAPEEYAPIIRDIEKEETHHLKFLEKIAEEMGEHEEETSQESDTEQLKKLTEKITEMSGILMKILDGMKEKAQESHSHSDSEHEGAGAAEQTSSQTEDSVNFEQIE